MKTTRFLSVMLLLCICTLGVNAQRVNQLTIEDIAVEPGTSADLPVTVSNTDAVVGLEFDLTLPSGITMDERATPTDRIDGHLTTVKKMGGDTYKVMLFSPSNKPILGNNGAVFKLHLHIPGNLEEGTEHQMSVQHAVLGIATGENVMTKVSAGKIRIPYFPDLIPKNIRADKTTINPGDHITVSWTVENLGELATGDGWSEQISLVADDGSGSKLIGTTYYYQSLAGKALVNRSAEIDIPKLVGMDGPVKLQVRIIPFETTKERENAKANNIQLGSAGYTVNKELTLEVSPLRLIENEVSNLYVKLTRSGRWTEEQTFNVTATADSRIDIPATITVPAGQSGVVVYMPVVDNTVLDNDSIVDISIAGHGYAAVTQRVIIEDNEFPDLIVTTSKSEVTEGETFQLTITTSRVSGRPIEVTVSCEDSKRFSFPSVVTIPAGSPSVTFDVEAVDNLEIEIQETVAFNATAERYNRGEVLVILNDNDMPTLSFTVSPRTVSESAGNSAMMGVIKRTDNFDKNVVIRLSDDNNGWLTYPSSVTLEPGEKEVEFIIGVKDNNLVDGDKTINLSAVVYASSCNCSVPTDSNGAMTQTVTITDNEGPMLTIKAASTSLLEGSTGNVFSISHNLVADHDVTVSITSDKDEFFEYDHTLVIPAGSQSADLLVDVKLNSQYGDSDLATFTVQGNGMSIGTCWVIITDQTMPDAIVSLTADKTEAEAGSEVRLTAEVKNIGHADLPASTELFFSFSGDSYRERMTIDKALAPGESKTFEYVYTLPSMVGDFTFQATVNPSQKVTELMYVNNSSEKVGIKLTPSFTVTAQVDKDLYSHGELVTITGKAKGETGKNAKVEVYLIHDGIRQAQLVLTDDEGNYSVTKQLLEREAGHFVVGACFPGSNESTEMDAFDVYGILLNSFFTTCQMGLTETFNGTIQVTNPGILAQTGVKVVPKAESANCEFAYTSIDKIEGGETLALNFSIKGNGLTGGTSWQQMPITISTNEGSEAVHTLYYYVQPLTGALQASTTHIDATMTMGKVREYPITIHNIGKGETGKITFALPNWISTTTAHELASLGSGDSATVVLRFSSTDEMKLNVPVKGQLGINCANGNGVGISFTVTPVSEETGTLTVDVVDEMAFFTDEAPHLANARVVVKTPVAGTVVAEGVTGEDGKFATTLPEGWYTLSVSADSHNSYSNTLIVNPGINNEQEVFLAYNAITYTWEVVETEIEDVYEIETVATFDTRVPKPVVIVSLPNEAPEPYNIVPMTVTNEGLISAVNINVSLTMDKDYYFEFLNAPHLDELGAKESHVFYAKMMPIPEASHVGKRISKSDDATCITVIGQAKYQELCDKYEEDELSTTIKRWGSTLCIKNNYGGFGGGGGSGSGGGGSGSGGGGFGGGGYNGGGGGPGNPYLGGKSVIDDIYIIYGTEDPAMYCSPPAELPSLADGDPKRVACGDDFNLDYKLITNDGKRSIIKGVAADKSEVLIALDLATSQLPSEECKYSIMWSLPDGYGIIKNPSDWNNVVYQAPDDFPDPDAKEMKIFAQLTYQSEFSTGVINVPIVLTRPPLVLIHGLNSSRKTWKDFAKYVTNGSMGLIKKANLLAEGLPASIELYDKYQVYCVDYSKSNCSHFVENQDKPGRAINLLIRRYREHGILATRADLVGHSMGGILSRLHVQYVEGGRDNVHKIITVNTPHSGSEWGDLIMSSNWLKGIINDKQFCFSSTDAIEDLAVNSDATDNYLNNAAALDMMKGIPVHALSSEVVNPIRAAFEEAGEIGTRIGHAMSNNDWDYWWIKKSEDLGFYEKYLDLIDTGDVIVSLESQQGGLSFPQNINRKSTLYNSFHTQVTGNTRTWHNIITLLNESTLSDFFSLEGFKPVDRTVHSVNDKSWAPARLRRATSSLNLDVQLEGDILHVSMDPIYMDNERQSIDVMFSNGEIVTGKKSFDVEIPSVHEGKIRVLGVVVTDDEEYVTGEKSVNVSVARAHPIKLEMESDIYMFSDEKPEVTMTCTWDDGSETMVTPESAIISNGIVGFKDGYLIAEKAGKATAKFTYKGLSVSCPITIYDASKEEGDESESICTSITLSFKQEMVMTRQAFRGTLTVNNGSTTGAMEDVKLNLEVRNSEGKLMTSHEFQINPESLDGFVGELDFNSGWRLEANGTGVATILFIPTKYAAPTEPEECSFGGTFSYKDPTTGLYVTRDLNPVTLTVKPSPELDLDYFLQRDVFGDDPLTEEVEPMRPAEFALLINNKGYGDATNVRMTTYQPEIVDNEKGLLIDFEILSSQVNGEDANLAFGTSIVNQFGTIPSQSQSYAQWWLQSSLLGHFTNYSVSYNHVTSYGNEDLSLLDKVRIHELIHGFTPTTGGRGFLVNDLPDQDDLPDQVYLTDATQHDVQMSSGMSITPQSDTAYMLTVSAGHPGWTYGSLPDPTSGLREVTGVVRQSDGKVLPLDNVWQTDRTLRDGKDPLYENLLHFVGEVLTGTESYLVTFGEMADIQLDVAGFKGLPAEGEVSPVALTEVVVEFNKPILPETFTSEDLRLTCQGTSIDVSGVTVSQVSDVEYAIDLSGLTLIDGYYVLTVSTADITDAGGFRGKNGRSASWIQESGHGTLTEKSVSGLVTSQLDGHPVEGAVVTLSHNSLKYTGKTNSSGKYVITVADVSLSYDVTCTAEGYMDAAEESVTIPSEGLMLDFSLERGATIIMPDDGICTYSGSLDLDFTKARGGEVKAYYAKSYASSTVFIEETPTAVGGEGLILLGTPLSRIDVPEAETASAIEGNLLFGTGFAPYEVVSDDIYVLANKTGKAKFHRAAEGLVIPRHKAYIVLFEDMIISQNNGADVVIGDPTGLYGVRWRSADDRHYGVGGVPVHEKARGVHIQKGKKFIVK